MSSTAVLEHVNITVRDAAATAASLCRVFGWKVRWSGPSIHEGYSVHVGGEDHYIALYTAQSPDQKIRKNYLQSNGLTHIGIVVEDLDAAEQKVIAAGYVPQSHQDYEPGRRFYYFDDDGIEYEVISYAPKRATSTPSVSNMLGQMSENSALMR